MPGSIFRCARCGALVHPSDERIPAAWCSRCERFTEVIRDGSDVDERETPREELEDRRGRGLRQCGGVDRHAR
jgi:hypothetical protein